MGRIALYPADPETVPLLIEQMRELDRAEVAAASGTAFKRLFEQAIDLSYEPGEAWAADGRLVCMFGVVPLSLMSDTCVVWFVGTDAVGELGIETTRKTKQYLDFCAQRYPKMFNYVDARNTPSILWLKRLGFAIEPAAPYGRAGLPFHRFHKGF